MKSMIAAFLVAALSVAVEAAVPANFPQLMLTAVNAERAKLNLPALCTNSKLQKAAQLHSEDQAKNNFMSHTGSTGSTMTSRVEAQGFKWNSLGENVAAGQVDVPSVMAAWMSSPGHKANILGDYKFFGTGYAYSASSTYQHYWTQDFAKGASEACDPVASDSVVQSPTVTPAVPTPAPTTTAPTPAPTTKTPASTPTVTPAPVTTVPTPAPTTTIPAPAPTQAPTTVPPTPAPTPALTPAPTTSDRSGDVTLQKRMLDAVNAERAKAGKAPLCTNSKLQKAAQLHSDDQAKNNFMSHTGSNGSSMSSRVTAQNLKWNSLGENVAAGQVDVAAVMTSWMNSPGHKANILGDYMFFGMGYAYSASSSYKYYWTQDFAKGSTEACDA